MTLPYREASPRPTPQHYAAKPHNKFAFATTVALSLSSYAALYHASRIAVRDGRIPVEFEVTSAFEGWLLLAIPSGQPSSAPTITAPPETNALLFCAAATSLCALGLVAKALVAARRTDALLDTAPYAKGLPGFVELSAALPSPRYATAYVLCAALNAVAFVAALAAL